MSNCEINLELHPKQALALETTANEILYGGAAGGGKSYLMRIAAILLCASIPQLQVYIFRRIREDLVKNHVEGTKGFRSMLAPWEDAKLVQIVEDEIRFLWNGSKIYLCHCKDEKDRFKYQGAEIHLLLIDEATHFTDTIYRYLRSRVRAVGLKNIPKEYENVVPRIILASNPGGIGHQWVKDAFIDPVPPLEIWQTPDEEGGLLRQFIPAKLDDNPSMSEDDPDYRMRLRGLGSPELVKAYEEGSWDIVAGAFFPEFTTTTHVVAPHKIPKDWSVFASYDHGSAAPFSVQWWAISDGSPITPDGERARGEQLKTSIHYPRESMVLMAEWYGAEKANKGLKLPITAIAGGILRREREMEITPAYRVADPAIFRTEGGPSIAEQFMQEGVHFRAGDNTRIAGWEQIRKRLVGREKPLLYVFSTCRDFIRTITAIQHDERKPEDLDTMADDHTLDACRYMAMSRVIPTDIEEPEEARGAGEMTFNELLKLQKQRLGYE
jgi:hypothetical protein